MVTKNSTSVTKNKKMSMIFQLSNQDVHTKQTNQKSFQTKRQHWYLMNENYAMLESGKTIKLE